MAFKLPSIPIPSQATVIACVGAALILVATYFLGRAHGDAAGYKRASDEKQKVINKMTKDENDRRQEASDKADRLIKESQDQAATIKALQYQLDNQTPEIITQYKTEYVEVAKSCGLSTPTVQAVNKLLGIK